MALTKFIDVEVTVTPDDDAYTANDVVGGLLTFAVPAAAGGGILNAVKITDDDNEGAVLELHLFREAPTAIADDAAYAPTAADLRKKFCRIDIAAADWKTENSLKWVDVSDLNNTFSITSGNLYGYLVCTATPTYAAGKKLYINLSIITE